MSKETSIELLEQETVPDDLILLIREIFKTDRFGRPVVTDGEILYNGYQLLKQMPHALEEEILYYRFYKDREQRYEALIAPHMVDLKPQPFNMGSGPDSKYLYCGEEPSHSVRLSPYKISKIPVTEEIYHEYNRSYEVSGSRFPVVNVTWYDAFMFAVWCDAELPTEAEWEYACRGGINGPFFCAEEHLAAHAWFSENSKGSLHEIAQHSANPYGLYDMLGNVWEWCLDTYDSEFYHKGDVLNPVNLMVPGNKSCRGGSFHSFTDMCRPAFRHHEPASFYAYDLGFRVSKR
ncbi:formylglycine-generating enzyme family protein [Paenibacillus sp. FSL R10-2736]|uniref:formylglycine-generating enzyme family protein n=1 Tax=Paenibacillus sp. FSL R10-2736 TaxID=2954692 RepID=UPI0030F53AF6